MEEFLEMMQMCIDRVRNSILRKCKAGGERWLKSQVSVPEYKESIPKLDAI